MKILSAQFVKTAMLPVHYPDPLGPEIAFAGRSNVGKSSVINSLVDRKNLVKVSKIPGKTLKANFFRINDSFYLVDFPGYGYAKHSMKDRNKIIKRIFWYVKHSNVRPKAVFLIIDAKVGLTVLDREMIKILEENKHQIVIVANKIDKLGKTIAEKQILTIQKEAPRISVLPYSAKTNEGKGELTQKIASFV